MGKYIISIDQSTSASKAFLLDDQGAIAASLAIAHKQYYPAPGRVEHDAREIWANVVSAITQVIQNVPAGEIAALAISNQRETTVLWDRETGEPLCPAIVWQDVRGEALCEAMKGHASVVREKTGLPLSPYYSALKAASVLRENPDIFTKAQKGQVCIGTVDSYLVFRLTGGRHFQTDVSNASRTQLFHLQNRSWDEELCRWFDIPPCCLPAITLSDGDFGQTNCAGLPGGIAITGVLGDSHAAFFGQGCLHKGMAKATYGTGSSVMMNVGLTPILSENGLSASVGFGFQGKVCYVLEGNVTSSGDTLCWLRDEMAFIQSVQEVEDAAKTVSDTGGVYLVPAFSGLGAPHFHGQARALLCGISRGTKKEHILRAAMESMAYQNADVLAAMEKDIGSPLSELRVDGGPTKNSLLMQFQADLLRCPVQCAGASELSALGAGFMAGIAAGVYPSLFAIPAMQKKGMRFTPSMEEPRREGLYNGWRSAVLRAEYQPESK